MKRFLSLFLVALTVFSLTIPVLAVDYSDFSHVLYGKYKIHDSIYDALKSHDNLPVSFDITSLDGTVKHVDSISYSSTSKVVSFVFSDNTTLNVFDYAGDVYIHADYSGFSMLTWDFGDGTSVTESFYNLVLNYGVSTNVGGDIGVWDSVTYPYAVVVANDMKQYWLTVSDAPFERASDSFDAPLVSLGKYQTYKLSNSGTWVLQSNGTGEILAGEYCYLLYSTHKIHRFVATPDFFIPPPPLAEVIQGVAEETIQAETLPTMAGTIQILLLCGVGLMALLVVLKLFGKRSLIYRN